MSKISLPFSAFLFSLFLPFILHHLKQPSLHTSSFSGPCHPSSRAPWLSGSGEGHGYCRDVQFSSHSAPLPSYSRQKQFIFLVPNT